MPPATTVTRDPALEAHVFWFQYRREILMGIGLIVLALLGYAAYWLYTDRRDSAAAAALAKAHDASGYQQLISRYESTNAGATAYLLLADAQRKAGKYADSNTTLQKFNPVAGDVPIEGVHWKKGPLFGLPTSATTLDSTGSFQTPRTYRVSLVLRY